MISRNNYSFIHLFIHSFQKFDMETGAVESEESSQKNSTAPSTVRPRALVIDGPSLISAMDDTFIKSALLEFSNRCRAVIACRVSPDQKRALVNLVKTGASLCVCVCTHLHRHQYLYVDSESILFIGADTFYHLTTSLTYFFMVTCLVIRYSALFDLLPHCFSLLLLHSTSFSLPTSTLPTSTHSHRSKKNINFFPLMRS